MNEKIIARQALAALTRLRQGCSLFDKKALNRFMKDSAVFPECCEVLNIPEDYSNITLDFLQRISNKKGGK